MAVFATLAAAPTLAQTSGGFPKYVLQEDGTVRIEGDATTDCTTFATGLEQGILESGDISAEAQRVLEQCVEAGLLDPELAASAGAPVSASSSATAPALPETGGPAISAVPVLLLPLLGLGGLFALRLARR